MSKRMGLDAKIRPHADGRTGTVDILVDGKLVYVIEVEKLKDQGRCFPADSDEALLYDRFSASISGVIVDHDDGQEERRGTVAHTTFATYLAGEV